MKYNIAGIIVDLNIRFPRLKRQSEAYRYAGELPANITTRLTEEFFELTLLANPHLDYESIEYIWMGSEFYKALLHFNGMLLHSSCVVYEDKAYLFSAPCGTGKSTHTQIWLKRFPGAYILNDDKPAIRFQNDTWIAYGTPWSGKNDISVNTGVPVAGIAILERGEFNQIDRCIPSEVIHCIYKQINRKTQTAEFRAKQLELLDKLITQVPIWKLKCNMEPEAAIVAYEAMSGEKWRKE